MLNKNNEPGFEEYRLQRQRRRLTSGETHRQVVENTEAVREIEMAEAREAKDRQLTREVHDFFESATKTAANIVAKVAEDVRTEISGRLAQEMQDFLMDALQRMNVFVQTVMLTHEGRVAEEELVPQMQNIVGPLLDGFRGEGTANVPNKHIGEDPFATESSAVLAEINGEVEDTGPERVGTNSAPRTDIEDHPAAELLRQDEADEAMAAAAKPPVAMQKKPASVPPAPVMSEELERFKGALKSLVRQGMMTKEEARTAWQTKVKTQGLAR